MGVFKVEYTKEALNNLAFYASLVINKIPFNYKSGLSNHSCSMTILSNSVVL